MYSISVSDKKYSTKNKTVLTDVFTKDIIVTPSGTESTSSLTSDISQQQKINTFNNTNYSKSANAVKLLTSITNNNGKIKLYTEINSNFKVGDKVYIMYNSGSTSESDGIIIDNYLEFINCDNNIYLQQLQGYTIIETNDNNNEITIDRYYDSRFSNKKIYNHYISKIYMRNATINGGEIDGVEILNVSFNTLLDSSIDINLVQSVILSGNGYYIRYKDKYDDHYITTNSSVNSGVTESVYKPYIYKGIYTLNQDPTPVSSYYTNNNEYHGYNFIYNNSINYSRIDNGHYENCIIRDSYIYGGIFMNCDIYNTSIYGGVFNDCPLDSNCYWFNGTWSGGTFELDIWYDGIWNGGIFNNKMWLNGIFNDGDFTNSTWINGTYQGGKMDQSVWSGGTFSGNDSAYINNSSWFDGIFNSGNMQNCVWYSGITNGGNFLNTDWKGGTFNDGTFDSGLWYDGVFNNGNIINTKWEYGTFNGGTFNSQNNIPLISNGKLSLNSSNNTTKYWADGTFNGGTFNNSIWSNGMFKNGDFTGSSLWSGGTFVNGNFTNSSWINGSFLNGTVNKSYFSSVDWSKGIWNSGTLGIILNESEYPIINWSGGTFNNGIFGYIPSSLIYNNYKNVNWYDGNFYGGTFNTYHSGCTEGWDIFYGGFYGGTFYDGVFNGVFWKGNWVNGIISPTSCNKSGVLTHRDYTPKSKRIITRKFGELPIKVYKNNNINNITT